MPPVLILLAVIALVLHILFTYLLPPSNPPNATARWVIAVIVIILILLFLFVLPIRIG
jgi:hypothetical protein